jgi:hypothetical protein
MPHRCRSGDTQKSGHTKEWTHKRVDRSEAASMKRSAKTGMWCIGCEKQSCSPDYAHVRQTSSVGLGAWVLTFFPFTCSTLVVSSLVSASTLACMHATPPQHSQHKHGHTTPLKYYIPACYNTNMTHHQHHTNGVTHCSQNCVCDARKASKSCFKHKTCSFVQGSLGGAPCNVTLRLSSKLLLCISSLRKTLFLEACAAIRVPFTSSC